MKFNIIPSQRYLQNILEYDPETGVFSWKIRRGYPSQWNDRYSGNIAGQITENGYWVITIDYKSYRAHRLAWVYMYGELDQYMEIDHINGDRLDNCLSNLRLATKSKNMANSRGKSRSGLPKGVERNKKRFSSRIMIDGNRINLGTYDTPEEAHIHYSNALRKYFGEFARVE